MIYTIGKTTAYERYFQEQGTPKKKGRTEDYAGGSVFETQESANRYLRRNDLDTFYSVYGVDADWDLDTTPTTYTDSYRSLLRDAPLIKL